MNNFIITQDGLDTLLIEKLLNNLEKSLEDSSVFEITSKKNDDDDYRISPKAKTVLNILNVKLFGSIDLMTKNAFKEAFGDKGLRGSVFLSKNTIKLIIETVRDVCELQDGFKLR